MANHMTTRGKHKARARTNTHRLFKKCISTSFCDSEKLLGLLFLCFTDILNRSKMTHNQTGRSVSLRHTIKKRRCHHLTTFTHTALVCSETHLHWYTQTHTHITVALKQVNTFCCRFCSQLQSNWNSDCFGAFQSHRYRNTTTPICTHW